jgi:prepilin-type N-terminal cleavage/methylation domain-containing protein
LHAPATFLPEEGFSQALRAVFVNNARSAPNKALLREEGGRREAPDGRRTRAAQNARRFERAYGRRAFGFTLLELLVVVAILSAVAVASFGLVGEDRAQVRIEDTRNRLGLLRRAVLGVESPAYGGEMRFSGFVADNGRLPVNLRELIDDGVLAARGAVQPDFYDSIDSECVQTTTGTKTTLGEAARLLKGHRGSYLSSVAHNGEFRDGWGNVGTTSAEEAINFGWDVGQIMNGSVLVPDSLSITSLGADNAPGNTGGIEAETDQSMSIAPADWKIPLDGWKVTLKNMGSGSIAIDPDGHLGVTLMVFENTGTPGSWRQYRSQDSSCDDSKTSLDAGESCEFSFTNATGCTDVAASVPLGRHVLVLTAKHELSSGRRIVTQVDFFPGTLPPNLVWEIR